MVHVMPPPGWDTGVVAAGATAPMPPGEPALTISTTLTDIPPVGALDDLSAVADALDAPIAQLPVEMTAAVPVVAKAKSPVLLWSLGGAASVLVVGGLLWAIWPTGTDSSPKSAPPTVAQTDQPAPAEEPAVPKAAEPSSEEPQPTSTETKVADSQPAATEPEQPQSDPVATDPPADPVAKLDTPVEPTPTAPAPVEPKASDVKATATPAPPTDTVATVVPKVDEVPSHAPDHSQVLKFDPLDFDLEHLGGSGKATADVQPSTNSVPDRVPSEPADAPTNNTAAPDVADAPGPQPPTADVPPPVAVNGVFARRGPLAEVSQQTADQALAANVKSLTLTDIPLASFVETMSGLAGTGITLDPLALEQVGISPQATVHVEATDVPLRTVLHDALTQRRLDIGQQDGWLRVVLPKADESRAIDYDVKDLAVGNDIQAVADLIQRFVAPSTWKSAGGKGTITVDGTKLHIEQSDAVRRQIVIFAERLRLARSLTIQSKYPSALLSIESPYTRLADKLGQNATFTFLPWTRMADVVRNLQSMSGLVVFVDWGALAESELGPSSPVACSVNDRSWEQALDGVLEPLGLAWWAIDSRAIQITTPAALSKIERVEFYRVPQKLRASFASDHAFVEALQKDLEQGAGGKPLSMQAAVDAPSGRLIVLASPTVHRQLSKRLVETNKPGG